jgi:hypothetical protein
MDENCQSPQRTVVLEKKKNGLSPLSQRLARTRAADGRDNLQIWSVAANPSNKQSAAVRMLFTVTGSGQGMVIQLVFRGGCEETLLLTWHRTLVGFFWRARRIQLRVPTPRTPPPTHTHTSRTRVLRMRDNALHPYERMFPDGTRKDERDYRYNGNTTVNPRPTRGILPRKRRVRWIRVGRT